MLRAGIICGILAQELNKPQQGVAPQLLIVHYRFQPLFPIASTGQALTESSHAATPSGVSGCLLT